MALRRRQVKGLALTRRDELTLEPFGALENRRFHLVDERGRFVNGLTRLQRSLFAVVPEWDPGADSLRLTFPDGEIVEGSVLLGDELLDLVLQPDGARPAGRGAVGARALGVHRAAAPARAHRRARAARSTGPTARVSLVSDESVDELARQAGVDSGGRSPLPDADRRRGRRAARGGRVGGGEVALGDAVVRVLEQVARCAITTKHPDTGERDLDTLRVIKQYRGVRGAKALDFGVYGEVVTPGRVRVGDAVVPLSSVR